MIIQAIIGAVMVHRVVKIVRKHQDIKALKAFGEAQGYKYVPGESIENYRKMLLGLRNVPKVITVINKDEQPKTKAEK